jgi:hypothetical protein
MVPVGLPWPYASVARSRAALTISVVRHALALDIVGSFWWTNAAVAKRREAAFVVKP